MSIAGLHLTQIGARDFLLEPSRSLNIRERNRLIEEVSAKLQAARACRLYYDLAELPLIDPFYYSWLEALARALKLINIGMICIHMQPTAAYALARFLEGKPPFETAVDIQGWQRTGQ